MTLLLAAIAATTHAAPAHHTPAQRVAIKALAGDYGKLQQWQRDGYERILSGTTQRTLVITAYGPWEGRDGQVDCKGKPLFSGAMASNKLTQGSYVYLPTWGRLFRVVDRGSSRNDKHQVCLRTGGIWADVWVRTPREARGRADWTPTRAEVAR